MKEEAGRDGQTQVGALALVGSALVGTRLFRQIVELDRLRLGVDPVESTVVRLRGQDRLPAAVHVGHKDDVLLLWPAKQFSLSWIDAMERTW